MVWLFSSVVERCPEEAGVPSSNLGGATKNFRAGVAQLLERILAKDEAQG